MRAMLAAISVREVRRMIYDLAGIELGASYQPDDLAAAPPRLQESARCFLQA